MKPEHPPQEKKRSPEESDSASKEQTGAGEGLSTAPSWPSPVPQPSRSCLKRSDNLPARKKVRLPVIPFWKGAPYPRPLVKYTNALPLRQSGPQRNVTTLPLLPSSKVTFSRPEATCCPSSPSLGPVQTRGRTFQSPESGQERNAGTTPTRSLRPLRPLPQSRPPCSPPALHTPQAPADPSPKDRPQEAGDGGGGGEEVDMTKASKAVRSLQLCSPTSGVESSPSPPPQAVPLQRRRPRYLSRRYLRQMEWYRALRKEKKLRDTRKRLDELCSEVTMCALEDGALRKGLLDAAAQLKSKDLLIPGPSASTSTSCSTTESSESSAPFNKKRKRSPPSGMILPPTRAHQKRALRRSWKLDSSSGSSSSGSPATNSPVQTPTQAPVCSPAASCPVQNTSPSAPTPQPPKHAALPLCFEGESHSDTDILPHPSEESHRDFAPSPRSHTERDPNRCSSTPAKALHSDTGPTPLCSSDKSHIDTSPMPRASAVAMDSMHSQAAPAVRGTSLNKNAHNATDAAASGTSLTEDSRPDSALAPPTSCAPACEDRRSHKDLSIKTCCLNSRISPARNVTAAGRVSDPKNATDVSEGRENTAAKRSSAVATLKNCNKNSNSTKTTPPPTAQKTKESNSRLNDTAGAVSEIKYLSAVKTPESHLCSAIVRSESQTGFSVRRKSLLAKTVSTASQPPAGPPAWQNGVPRRALQRTRAKMEIISPLIVLSSENQSSLMNKKCACPVKNALSTTFAVPCKPSKAASRPALKTEFSKADETAKKSSARKTTSETKPCGKNSKSLKKASLSKVATKPSRSFILDNASAVSVSRVANARRHKKQRGAKKQHPPPALSRDVCRVCQCPPLLKSLASPHAVKAASARRKGSSGVTTAGRKSHKKASVPTPKRVPKEKRKAPTQQDWTVVGSPLFSTLETGHRDTTSNKKSATPHSRLSVPGAAEPKTHRDASPHPNTCTSTSEYAPSVCSSSVSRGSSGYSTGQGKKATGKSTTPFYSPNSILRADPLQVGKSRPVAKETEVQTAVSMYMSPPPPLQGALPEFSPPAGRSTPAFASPDTPMPGDNTWMSSICDSDSPRSGRPNTPYVRNAERPSTPKSSPRKTLFMRDGDPTGTGDHGGLEDLRKQRADRDCAMAGPSRVGDNAAGALWVGSHKGAPHSQPHSRDHGCRTMDKSLGQGVDFVQVCPKARAAQPVGAAGSSEPWDRATPPATPVPPHGPELIRTLVNVMSSLLGLQSTPTRPVARETCEHSHTDQEGSCPAKNLGFLVKLKEKRQRLEELQRRVECLTLQLQEAREELQREMNDCHRAERDERGGKTQEETD